MKYILIPILFIVGCSNEYSVAGAYQQFCERQPDSVSCTQYPETNLAPSFQYVVNINYELLENFTYETDQDQYGVSEYWFDNTLSSEKLKGDCDDISLTFASQLILYGYNPGSIQFIVSGTDGVVKHFYIKVKLDDGTYFNFYKNDKYDDMMSMSYDSIGTFKSI